jgi:hypothetical protein
MRIACDYQGESSATSVHFRDVAKICSPPRATIARPRQLPDPAASWIVDLPELVSSLSPLLSLASTILFLVFLKKIAAYVDDNTSERRAGNVLNLLIGTFVTVILGVFLPPLLIVALLMVIVGFIMYVLLLMGLMKSLKAA